MIRPLPLDVACKLYTQRKSQINSDKKLQRRRLWRQIVWEETSGRCAYCGQETPTEYRTIEHVIPKALGGKWHISNIMPACADCNSRRPNNVCPTLYCKDLILFFYVLTKEMTAHQNFQLSNRQSR